MHLKRIIEELDLQPAQVEKIRPVVAARMLDLFNQRARFLDANHALREVMEREVAEFMTPEQRAKYEKMNREYHERTRRQERGERPPPGPDRPRDKRVSNHGGLFGRLFILVERAGVRPTVRLGQAPCMGRRVNPARAGRQQR